MNCQFQINPAGPGDCIDQPTRDELQRAIQIQCDSDDAAEAKHFSVPQLPNQALGQADDGSLTVLAPFSNHTETRAITGDGNPRLITFDDFAGQVDAQTRAHNITVYITPLTQGVFTSPIGWDTNGNPKLYLYGLPAGDTVEISLKISTDLIPAETS